MAVVGLWINESKPAAVAAAQTLARFLAERGVETRMSPALAGLVAHAECGADEAGIAAADFVVVLGGDGTLLAAARRLAPCGTPLLGVHLGSFGFITEAHPDDLIPAVDRALRGEAVIHERLMLAADVRRANGADAAAPETLLGVNDIVVASGAVRMVNVRTRVGEETLATYAADGVIVASPTGSTGYSLSAGGPLVHPSAPVLLITPISPHTLNVRSVIIPDTETVHLTVEGGDGTVAGTAREPSVVATVDGQVAVSLRPGDTVSVCRAPHTVRLLSVGGPNFYQKIRARWHYGERNSY